MKPTSFKLSSDQELLIREAEPEDAKKILEYVEVVSKESDVTSFGPGEFELSEKEESGVLESYKEKSNSLYLVAIVENEIVGALSFLGGKRKRIKHCGEFGMSVRKSHWRKGIGSHLISTLIGWAQIEGNIKKINLRVRTNNHKAISLYLKFGFTFEGKISDDFIVNGRYFDHYCMGLSLRKKKKLPQPVPPQALKM